MFQDLFDDNNIYEKLDKDSITKNGYYTINTNGLNKINFTAFYICPKTVHKGVYIIDHILHLKEITKVYPINLFAVFLI